MPERPDPSRLCFGCGSENPQGLRMRFRAEDGRAVASYTPPQHLQGYPGRAHGGCVATMLDEAMGWAVYGQGIWAVTVRITTRFRKPVRLNEPVEVSGWVTRDRGRFLELRGELRSAQDEVLAEADGVFVRVSGEQAEEMRQFYEASVS